MKTKAVKKSEIKENWYLVDATGQRIGRLSTVVAELMMGKNDVVAVSASHLLPQNKVVVINSDKLYIPQKKMIQKTYTQYSGYPGGLRKETLEEVMNYDSRRVIEHAVRGMLPRNKRGNAIFGNLYIYQGAEHKHDAQQPKSVKLN